MTRPATVSELRDKATEAADAAPLIELHVAHDSIHSALVHALADLTIVRTGRTVTVKMKEGGTYTYDYADLGDVVKLTRPVLHRHGLAVLTPLSSVGSDLAVSVVFLHEGGGTMEFGPFTFPHGRDAQATGSAVTYHRRYALVAALGMAAGDDDDGAAAQPRPAQPEPVLLSKDDAVAHVKQLAEGDTDLAKQAWTAIWETPWTRDALTAAFEAWVNQPADDESGEVP